jgi:hypothetical protein
MEIKSEIEGVQDYLGNTMQVINEVRRRTLNDPVFARAVRESTIPEQLEKIAENCQFELEGAKIKFSNIQQR